MLNYERVMAVPKTRLHRPFTNLPSFRFASVLISKRTFRTFCPSGAGKAVCSAPRHDGPWALGHGTRTVEFCYGNTSMNYLMSPDGLLDVISQIGFWWFFAKLQVSC
jgi:hypothetical protein